MVTPMPQVSQSGLPVPLVPQPTCHQLWGQVRVLVTVPEVMA